MIMIMHHLNYTQIISLNNLPDAKNDRVHDGRSDNLGLRDDCNSWWLI